MLCLPCADASFKVMLFRVHQDLARLLQGGERAPMIVRKFHRTEFWLRETLVALLCSPLYCTVLYRDVMYCNVLQCRVMYCTVLY